MSKWRGLWLPTAYLLLLAGALHVADRASMFRVVRPGLLLGLIPLIFWTWWIGAARSRAGFSRGRQALALFLRFLLLTAIFLLLADPRAVKKSDDQTTIYVLDVSDSMSAEASDKALGYVLRSRTNKREQDKLGLIVFGRQAVVELPPRNAFPFEAINSHTGRDGSNTAEALSLAASILPPDRPGRVILIGDGRATEGDLAAPVDALRRRGVPVDVLPISFDFTEEVWLERLDLPSEVKEGENYDAALILSSLKAGAGEIALHENGKAIFRQHVTWNAGKNRYAIPIRRRGPGYYEYLAEVTPDGGRDGWKDNNVAVNDLHLQGKGKILLVSSPEAKETDWTLFLQALRDVDRVVEKVQPADLPRDARKLQDVDCLIFADVAAEQFDAAQFRTVKDAVHDQGTGFLMIGGENSFGPGGYRRTDIEKILPVSMDVQEKRTMPKSALAIILHTCEFAEGNTWAKLIAKEAIRVLSPEDEAGVLDYEFSANGSRQTDDWIFPLTPVSRMEEMLLKLNQAEPSDMPGFEPSMALALAGLKKSDASMKHVIIISDGDPQAALPATLRAYVENKISVTTVVIEPHGGNDISNMRQVAETTGGRYYFPKDPGELPSIFVKEAKTLKRNMIQNVTFTPIISFPSPILKGLEPVELKGYVLSSPKDRAELILRAPAESKEFQDEINPVLAVWRYGAGRTAAWTSDLESQWAAEWMKRPLYSQFVRQLVEDISRVRKKTDLSLQTRAEGEEGRFILDDQGSSPLEFTFKATGPDGEDLPVRVDQTSPGQYQGRFPLRGRGVFRIVALGSNGERADHAVAGISVSYSREYLNFSSDPATLSWIAKETGGKVLDGSGTEADSLLATHPPPREGSRPVPEWLFWALAILLPLDVGARRIQFGREDLRALFRLKRPKAPETAATLVKLKRENAVHRTTGTAAPPSKSAPPPTTLAPAKEPDDNLTTAERLLRNKRDRRPPP